MIGTTLVPGGHDVQATLDPVRGDGIGDADEADDTDNAATGRDAVVIACPSHSRQQGHRGDTRLIAVNDALTAHGVDCLRPGYGVWDEGYSECADALQAVE